MPMVRATVTWTPRSDLGRFVSVKITPAAITSAKACAEIALEKAQEIVPVDTGELKASGHAEVRETESTVVGDVIFDADHAAYVEFGTGRRGAASAGAGNGPYNENWPGMAATPYLRSALDIAREQIKENFKSNLSAALR